MEINFQTMDWNQGGEINSSTHLLREAVFQLGEGRPGGLRRTLALVLV